MIVGMGPPDEIQEMLTLPPSETVTITLVSAVVFVDAFGNNNHNVIQ